MEENKEVKTFERKVIRISRKKLIIGAIVFVVVLAVATLVLGSLNGARMKAGSAINSTMMDSAMPINGFGFSKQDSSYKDTREFMKTGYDSEIKTRDVSGIVRDVKNAVKGADGRIDNIYSSEKYGSIDFVVAKSKFDDFKDEIESLTHKKLYTETISSTNMLSDKQNIEGQIDNANQSLESLTSKKKVLDKNHTDLVNTINKDISSLNAELAAVRLSISKEKNSEIIVSLREQETSLVNQLAYQNKRLISENNSYKANSQSLNLSINNAKGNLSDANKADDKFTDNIETVNGSVRVEWVSLWALAVIFSPIHPTIIIIILVVLGIICFRKRMPKVEIVK